MRRTTPPPAPRQSWGFANRKRDLPSWRSWHRRSGLSLMPGAAPDVCPRPVLSALPYPSFPVPCPTTIGVISNLHPQSFRCSTIALAITRRSSSERARRSPLMGDGAEQSRCRTPSAHTVHPAPSLCGMTTSWNRIDRSRLPAPATDLEEAQGED